jgi:hypothetical protein
MLPAVASYARWLAVGTSVAVATAACSLVFSSEHYAGGIDPDECVVDADCAGGGTACSTHMCLPGEGTFGASACATEPTAVGTSCPDSGVCNGFGECAIGAHLWSASFGSTANDVPDAVVSGPDNEVFVVGRTDGVLDLGSGPLFAFGGDDIFILKLSAGGDHVWSKGFGSAGDDGMRVAVGDDGSVALCGWFTGTIDLGGMAFDGGALSQTFVAKLGADGAHQWSFAYGDLAADDACQGVAIDAAGNVFVTGYFEGAIDFGGGSATSAGMRDVYVAKFDAAGSHQWSRTYGGPGIDAGETISVADLEGGDVDVLVGGPFAQPITFDVDPLQGTWFAATLAANGNPLNSRAYAPISSHAAYVANQVLLSGTFSGALSYPGVDPLMSTGGEDVFAIRQGRAVKFGDGSDQQGIQGAGDDAGNVVLVGRFDGTLNFGNGPIQSSAATDIFVAKLNRALESVWGLHFSAAAARPTLAVAAAPNRTVLMAASFSGTIDVGGGTLSSAGMDDFVIAAFSP